MWLWFEGLRRKLGRWLSFGCGGFEIHGGERADSAGERKRFTRRPWRREGEEELTERERVMEWARVGEDDVLAFNAAYGVAGEELDGRHVAATNDPRSRSR